MTVQQEPATSQPSLVERVARQALTAYDLPDPVHVQLLRALNNAVFQVDTGGGAKYALRVHRAAWRSTTNIASELLFMRAAAVALQGSRVEVPNPVETRSGNLVACVPDADGSISRCSLLTWVDGSPLRPGRGLGAAASSLLGEALARLHNAGAGFDSPPGFGLPRWDADGLFGPTSPYLVGADVNDLRDLLPAEDLALLHRVADRTRHVFEELERTGAEGQFGLVHNDFILGNCHFLRRQRDWRVAVLDFDDCGWGWFLSDFGAVLGNLADARPRYAALRRAFLDGYQTVRPLPHGFERHLPLMMATRHAAQCLWALGRGRNTGDMDAARRQCEVRMRMTRYCLEFEA